MKSDDALPDVAPSDDDHTTTLKTGPVAAQAAWLKDYTPGLRIAERGSILSIGDGIAWVSGLPSAAMDDILVFEDGSRAMIFDLTEDRIGAVLLHETESLTAGMPAHLAGRQLGIPVGDALIGRVIDPLGSSLDDQQDLAILSWQGPAQNFDQTPRIRGELFEQIFGGLHSDAVQGGFQ